MNLNRNLTVNEQQELRILELVEESDKVTQRGVATELEIAVGLANALGKRLVHKGYIKVKDAPSRRYGYYITPEGFMEKSRLVSKYIANSFKFFGQVRRDYEEIAYKVSASHCRGVCCVGTGEVLKIAQMVFDAHSVPIVCVIDILRHERQEYFKSVADIPKKMNSQIGCFVVTETLRPHKVFEIMSSRTCGKDILAPAFMKVNKSNFQPGRA